MEKTKIDIYWVRNSKKLPEKAEGVTYATPLGDEFKIYIKHESIRTLIFELGRVITTMVYLFLNKEKVDDTSLSFALLEAFDRWHKEHLFNDLENNLKK